MKKTSKKANVLKHFNDKFDSRVKEVMGAKKKFMDGGPAGVANSYNPVEGYKVNKGVGKSTFLDRLSESFSDIYEVGGIITLGQEKRKFVDVKTRENSVFAIDKEENGIQIGSF